MRSLQVRLRWSGRGSVLKHLLAILKAQPRAAAPAPASTTAGARLWALGAPAEAELLGQERSPTAPKPGTSTYRWAAAASPKRPVQAAAARRFLASNARSPPPFGFSSRGLRLCSCHRSHTGLLVTVGPACGTGRGCCRARLCRGAPVPWGCHRHTNPEGTVPAL